MLLKMKKNYVFLMNYCKNLAFIRFLFGILAIIFVKIGNLISLHNLLSDDIRITKTFNEFGFVAFEKLLKKDSKYK